MKTFRVLVLAGDGIGPEVTRQAVRILDIALKHASIPLELIEAPFGGASIDLHGTPATSETLSSATQVDAVLLGAVGGPKWDSLPTDKRPEKGLLALRAAMQVYANLRPAKLFSALSGACPLKESRSKGFDFLVVRELIGGIYFGQPRGTEKTDSTYKGYNTMVYSEEEIVRIGKSAFELARLRRKQLLSVDKANVLEVSQVWRSVISELGKEYPDVKLSHMYVDNAAMQIVLNPKQFDVIVTGNLFGDILSDEAAAITGSIGMLPSASIGEKYALYEPIHGSAPDIAGQGKANPLAAILSVGMMLDYTLRRHDLGQAVANAVDSVLNEGARTADIAEPGQAILSTEAMGEKVTQKLTQILSA